MTEAPPSLVLSGRAESLSANFRLAAGEKLKKISGQRDDAELRRLFYVAVTRARSEVVFVCSTHEDTRNVGFMKCLYEMLQTDKTALSAMWPEQGREVRATPIGPVAFEMPPGAAAGQTRRAPGARLTDGALEQELAAGEIVPADIPAPPPGEDALSTAEIAARRAGARNRVAGIVLHRVLELWDARGDLEPLLRAASSEAGADADSVARVRRRLAVVARSPIVSRIAAAETIGREMPVRFVENGIIVERRIDRLIRENGNDVVIDYKSGDPEGARVAKDREQVYRYCEAVAAITGRPCQGLLWYVGLEGDAVVET